MGTRTSFPRRIEPELLDALPSGDPGAERSRRDLRRINRLMGSAGIIAQAITRSRRAPHRILELGAGDGSLMLRLARRFAPAWPSVRLTLLDRRNVVHQSTLDEFHRLRWQVSLMCEDVNDWARRESEQCGQSARYDLIVANLFLHHFDVHQLEELFKVLAGRCDMFIACEPYRARLPLYASRLTGLIGAGPVTREDAVTSVRAGFCGKELSVLWPQVAGWRLEERKAGLFSHLLVAVREGWT